MSLKDTDDASAAVATHPRVALADIEEAIKYKFFTLASAGIVTRIILRDTPLETMTLCFLVMKNGFVVVGKSAPASPANFNKELGEKFAYEDAVRQLWPLMGFALRERLSQGVEPDADGRYA